MTNREFYDAIINGKIDNDVIDFAKNAKAKIDKTNEIRREKTIEKNNAKEPIREALFACITAEPKTATMLIAEAGLEIKPQSVPSLMKSYIEGGKIEKVDVKVSGKGKQKGYQLVSE